MKTEVSLGALMYHAIGTTFLIGGVITNVPLMVVAGVASSVIGTTWQYFRK